MNRKKLRRWICICVFLAAVTGGLIFFADRAAAPKPQTVVNTTENTQSSEQNETTDQQTTEPVITEHLNVSRPPFVSPIDFQKLRKKVNPDIIARLIIPGTSINYPVPRSEKKEDSYYLTHNLNGSAGYPGCNYMEKYNAADFTDPVTVLYGHNMRDGSSFGALHKYESKKYFRQHRTIYIYTPDKTNIYKVIAAAAFDNRHLLGSYDYTTDQGALPLWKDVLAYDDPMTILADDADVSADDHLLVLSTCISGRKKNRWLIIAVLVETKDSGETGIY